MTTPDPEPFAPEGSIPPAEPFAPEGALPSEPEALEPRSARARRVVQENPLLGWARAVVLGIGDTAKDMLEEGRRGAREAMDEGWERFDDKTKRRRKK